MSAKDYSHTSNHKPDNGMRRIGNTMENNGLSLNIGPVPGAHGVGTVLCISQAHATIRTPSATTDSMADTTLI